MMLKMIHGDYFVGDKVASKRNVAIASRIFAAPKYSNVLELLQVQNLLSANYGKEFIVAAAELRPDCEVNRLIIEKLSVRAPSGKVVKLAAVYTALLLLQLCTNSLAAEASSSHNSKSPTETHEAPSRSGEKGKDQSNEVEKKETKNAPLLTAVEASPALLVPAPLPTPATAEEAYLVPAPAPAAETEEAAAAAAVLAEAASSTPPPPSLEEAAPATAEAAAAAAAAAFASSTHPPPALADALEAAPAPAPAAIAVTPAPVAALMQPQPLPLLPAMCPPTDPSCLPP
ncbi:hypothetical protein L7F22_008221 [Adiantum nelumboides]|nr:hypothetical protein [Adiantum nelumboides]